MRWLRKGSVVGFGRMSLSPAQQRSLPQAALNSFVGSLHQIILLQALVKNHDSHSREVANPVLCSDYDSWLPAPLLVGADDILPSALPQFTIALELSDGLSQLRCDHGRAMAEWVEKLDEVIKVLESVGSGQRGVDSKGSNWLPTR